MWFAAAGHRLVWARGREGAPASGRCALPLWPLGRGWLQVRSGMGSSGAGAQVCGGHTQARRHVRRAVGGRHSVRALPKGGRGLGACLAPPLARARPDRASHASRRSAVQPILCAYAVWRDGAASLAALATGASWEARGRVGVVAVQRHTDAPTRRQWAHAVRARVAGPTGALHTAAVLHVCVRGE